MARIGVDAVYLSRSGKGVSRFQQCFVDELAHQATDHHFVIFLDAAAQLPELPNADHLTYVRVRKLNLIAWEQVQLPWLSWRYRIDLLQTWSDRLPLYSSKPAVLYLFEIPDYRHRSARLKATRYQTLSNDLTQRLFPYSIQKASKLLVSSQATSDDLIQCYQVPPKKISVVYPGPAGMFRICTDDAVKQQIRTRLGAPEGYILHFSSVNDPRDNTETVLRAFHASLQKLPHDKKLVIGGNCDLEVQGLTQLVRELDLESRIVLTGFVIDQPLVELYWGADMYLDPSLYEGFGFQVLEAMACGTPVICSNVTSLPEVVGDAGIMAAPTDVASLSEAIVQVLSDPDQAQEMRRRGIARAGLFSWSNTIQAMLNLYSEIS